LGIVSQAKLDDEAMDFIEQQLKSPAPATALAASSFCTECGASIPLGARFCPGCGKGL
jgi:ribosomal protein L40E